MDYIMNLHTLTRLILIVTCTLLLVSMAAATKSEGAVESSRNVTADSEKILACYYTRSSRLPASKVPCDMCTHLIYAFGVMSPSGISPNTAPDVDDYRTLLDLKRKNPSLKVMISLQKNFSSVVDKGKDAMISFAQSAVKFLKTYDFDGVDLDWEYPSASQKESFSEFILIFSKTLKESGLLLSMALPNAPVHFNRAYEVSTLNRNVDFMTVMAYDFHMYIKDKDNTTGYHSALVAPPGESQFLSAKGMVDFYESKGISPLKLLLGIPAYGRSWTLADPQRTALHSPAVGKGGPAPLSKIDGLYIYADTCEAKRRGASTVTDDRCKAEYLYHGKDWVAFESPFTVKAKTSFVRERRLKGVGIWALQIDDTENKCKNGTFPLTKAIREGLLLK